MNIKTIFCDMDGVIVDFRKGCEDLDAIEGTKVDWAEVHKIGPNFWADLDWTKDGQEFIKWLISFCKECSIDLCILSAVNYDDGVKGKQIWLDEKIPSISKQNRYFVRFGKDKYKYASKNALLIDDYGKNIEGFIMAGGQGVKFKNFQQAKEEIITLVK